MTKLYAGPFIGEFGWELFGWQGVIRYLADGYDKVIVIGRPEMEFLYQDFADYFLEHTPLGNVPNMWMNEDRPYPVPMRHKSDAWIQGQQMTLMPNAPQQTFIKYGHKGEGYDIVYHARSIDKYGSSYINFPEENWKDLLVHFNDRTIACIGSKDGALHFKGTEDLRGIPLSDLADVLASSRILIGPSSGPMHFGSLCGIPHVVWSGYKKSAPRYHKVWNPFKTPCKMISPDDDPWGEKREWQPDIAVIIEAIQRML